MLNWVKLDNILLTCNQGNFNQITAQSWNWTLVTVVVRDSCTATVRPAPVWFTCSSDSMLIDICNENTYWLTYVQSLLYPVLCCANMLHSLTIVCLVISNHCKAYLVTQIWFSTWGFFGNCQISDQYFVLCSFLCRFKKSKRPAESSPENWT